MRYLALVIAPLLLAGPHAAGQEAARAQALLLELKGPIGPAVSDFIERGIERAAADGKRAVILEMDTPGGLDTSMRVIIKSILASPVPGIVGAISLVLALYAFHVLPVNFAGVVLIVIGVALIVAELFLPSFGAIGVGGVVAFIIGSIILMDTDVEGYTVSMPLVVTVAAAAAALFAATVLIAVRQRKRPIVSGREEMIGATAEALEAFSESGQVRAHGEIWSARVSEPVVRGQSLRIKNIDGLTLEVEPDGKEK